MVLVSSAAWLWLWPPRRCSQRLARPLPARAGPARGPPRRRRPAAPSGPLTAPGAVGQVGGWHRHSRCCGWYLRSEGSVGEQLFGQAGVGVLCPPPPLPKAMVWCKAPLQTDPAAEACGKRGHPTRGRSARPWTLWRR